MIALIDKKIEDIIREVRRVDAGYKLRRVVKAPYSGDFTISQDPDTRGVLIHYDGSNETLHIAHDMLAPIAEVLLDIANEPATVDGMTALKHIMDGGGAYRIGGNKLFDRVPIRMRERDGQPEFWYKGIGGDWVGQSFTASMITATDWVLVP